MNRDEISRLREIFIIEYCKKKNWNQNELTTNQLLQITLEEDYITPIVKH